ncbi:MAG: helix-turn-helix domain-containing protein, partial [Chloroflexales bacterium]|nr:helix-turn-helix domain-containing protein [Chloroflexales bacterium]
PPPAPSLIDQSEATFPDDSEFNQDNAAPYLTQEIASEVRTVASSRQVIRGFLQDVAATKSIGVRWGQALIRELENLSWRIAHLRIQQAMTTGGITTSTDAGPIVQAAAFARAHTEFQLHALRDRLDAQGSLRGSARAELIALAEELGETSRGMAAAMDGVEVTDGAVALATWEALDSLPLIPTAHLAPPPRPPREPRPKQPQAKQPQAKSRRLTLEEAARQLGLSTGRVAELARNGELGRKEGGRWTFSEADVRRVARERADHEKAMKLRKKLENDRRRLNGLPPKRRKQRRKARDYDDDDEPPRRRRGRGLSVDDIGALNMLDQVLAQERALEQRYNLPFRAPLQTAALLHRCARCDTPLLFLIFGERAVDVAGLDAYGRLMEPHIKNNGVPAYVLGKANGTGDDAVSQLRRVWPDQGEVVEIAANRWEAFLEEQSQGHHCPP